MGKFVAKLTGGSDGHTVSRSFESKTSAMAWLQGEGLAEFDDQEAHGEIFDADGHLVWMKSFLQSIEQQERERMRDYAYFRAK